MTMKSVESETIAKPDGPWLRVSGAFTNLTALFTSGERNDVTVSIAPEAGWGSPAAFLPPAAGIEIDGEFWPDDFDIRDARPRDHRDWQNYPAIMGLLAHEVSHSVHSDWAYQLKKAHINGTAKLSQDEIHYLGAGELLEESRIENLHLSSRPQDTPWVQASATTICLAEALADDKLGHKRGAARAVALVLARAAGGSILPGEELKKVREAIVMTLGEDHAIEPGEVRNAEEIKQIQQRGQDLLAKLENIWTQFHNTPDGDTQEFMRLGKEWYELTQDDGSSGDDSSGIPQMIVDAIEDLAKRAMGDASGAEALGKLLKRLAEAVTKKVNEAKNQKDAKLAADQVFGQLAGPASGTYTGFRGYRAPTIKERQLAHQTKRKILRAYIREKAITTTYSASPPGRLMPRAAMQGQAQRAMGMYPTVEPFKQKQRAHTPSPPLKVGIIQDTSSSQGGPAAAASSGAYSLAAATRAIPDGLVAMCTFGDGVKAIFGPWEKPKGVPKLSADGGTDYLLRAMRATEGQLHLMKTGAARLLVIITDGYTSSADLAGRDPYLKRYLSAGIRVLWVVTGSEGSYANSRSYYSQGYIPEDVRGEHGEKVHVAYPYDDNSKIPELICSEAVKALEET